MLNIAEPEFQRQRVSVTEAERGHPATAQRGKVRQIHDWIAVFRISCRR